MTPEQMQALSEKITEWNYPEPEIKLSDDDVFEDTLMLYVAGRAICGALYASTMPDTQLQALITETVGSPEPVEEATLDESEVE
jgi:hypothetical protein